MDSLVPTASEARAEIEIAQVVSPSPLTPLGSKGLGESSSMTVPAVIANAVSDALSPLGVRINDLPMTPSKLWTLIERARTGERSRGAKIERAETGERSRVAPIETAGSGDRSRVAPISGHPRSDPASRTPLQ